MTHNPMIRRRTLIGGAALLVSGHGTGAVPTGGPLRLVAGTYDAEGGGGLYPVTLGPADRWSVGTPDPAVRNASFGVRSARFGTRYFLNEGPNGQLGAWRTGSGRMPIGSVTTGGADPCHAALDPAQTCLAVANYSSGSVAFYRLDPRTGAPIAPPLIRANRGHGPNPARQQGPHAHWVGFSPDRRWLHSVDLGTDAVLSYPFDSRGRTIGPPDVAYQAPAGSGPRHLAFHPHRPRAYLVSELGNSLTVLEPAGAGRFRAVQTLSTLPPGFHGDSSAAHLALNRAGTRLYVSNRGHDSVGVFAIDAAGGLARIQHVATGGSWPRFFLLCEAEARLVVANERAGTLVPFALAADGRLTRTGAFASVPGVVFLDRA
ncbi:MAG TPA: lactonase family protein [Sphingomonas sp.]|jgi:6-phosphogluconolactonase|uniref:lactonase family protein n=1 Tax=Sphingomonas sp. TaxID=28214 RepID=UPI002ED834AA